MATIENTWNVSNRMHSNKDSDNPEVNHIIAGADEIYDDSQGRKQNEVNTDVARHESEINDPTDGLQKRVEDIEAMSQIGDTPVETNAGNIISDTSLSGKVASASAVNGVYNALDAQTGYYTCGTAEGEAAKTVDAPGFVLSRGGSIKIKMTNANSANNATLNINSTGAKALYYDGERVSASNSWEAGETVEVYYDGTNFCANNVAGGSGSGDGAFDVSAKYPTSGVDGGNTYTLEGALAVLNANLSASKKKGGMSIKFVSSSDHKYVQYRCIADAFTTDTTQWAICDVGVYVEDPEFAEYKTDSEGKVLYGLKNNGDFYFGGGVPSQIHDAIETAKNVVTEKFADKLSILFFGNSLTQDTIMYLPWIFKSLCPEFKYKIINWFVGRQTLAEHLEDLNNPDFVQTVYIFDSEKYESGWVLNEGKNKLQEALAEGGVKHIVLQEYSARTDYNAESYSQAIAELRDMTNKDVMFHHLVNKTVMTMDRSEKESTRAYREQMYNKAITLARDVWNDQPISSIVNPGTAFKMAYDEDDVLYNVITSDDTYTDQTHAEEGLPALIENLLVAQWVFNLVGIQASIIDESLIFDRDAYYELGVWGVTMGANGPIFGTDAEQMRAQIVAQEALNRVDDIKTGLKNSVNGLEDAILNEIERATAAENALGTWEDDPEYIRTELDKDGKFLGGYDNQGKKVFATQKLLDTETIPEDIVHREEDSEGKIIEYTDDEGKKHLPLPTNQDDVIMNEVLKRDFIDIRRDNFDYHQECIFHDDFCRTALDANRPWDIGSNSQAINLADKYAYKSIYDDAIDDGFRLGSSGNDYYLTNVGAEYKGFRIVKNLLYNDSIVVEIANPVDTNKYQAVALNVINNVNYEKLECYRTSNGGGLGSLHIDYVKVIDGGVTIIPLTIDTAIYGNAIRFYFVNGFIRIYLDDHIVYTGIIGNIKNIGLFVESSHYGKMYLYKFFNIYYVSKNLKVVDTTATIDHNIINNGLINVQGQSTTIDTSNEYAYKLVSDVVDYGYCERFEVRYATGLDVTSDRQENTFKTPDSYIPMLCKYHLSFDLMFPLDFVGDDEIETIFQIHESAANYQSPCENFNVKPSLKNTGEWAVYFCVRSIIQQVVASSLPFTYNVNKEVYPVKPGEWHHFDLYVKQGYLPEHNPLTIVKVDGEEVYKTLLPNCYNVAKEDYPKYGMYKSVWVTMATNTTSQISYFDNFKIIY